MTVQLSWSWRRVRHQVRFWLKFVRLVVDWTVLVYLVLPGIAVGVYEGRRYYGGAMLAHVSPRTPVFGSVLPAAWMSFSLVIFVIVCHFAMFGKLIFPMQYGDRAFILLAPIRRSTLFTTIWVENTLGIYILLTVITLLIFPLLPLAGIPLWVWLVRMVFFGMYISSCRVIGILVRQSEVLQFKQWIAFQLGRIVFLLPPLIGLSGVNHARIFWLWLFAGSTAAVAGFAWRMQTRSSWDPLYRAAPNRLIELFAPGGSEGRSPSFAMKTPSRFLVHWLDGLSVRFRRQPLHPVAWLFILRLLRKRGIVWDYGRLSAAAVLVFHLVSIPWIRVIALCFCLFLFYQYWKSSIAVLYLVPAKEQAAASRFAIEVAGRRITVAAMIVTAGWWLAAGIW